MIHTVGSILRGGNQGESQLLANCYANSLLLAEMYGFHNLAFSNISTGVYGFPKAKAAHIAIQTAKEGVFQIMRMVCFVCFDGGNFQLYKNELG